MYDGCGTWSSPKLRNLVEEIECSMREGIRTLEAWTANIKCKFILRFQVPLGVWHVHLDHRSSSQA